MRDSGTPIPGERCGGVASGRAMGSWAACRCQCWACVAPGCVPSPAGVLPVGMGALAGSATHHFTLDPDKGIRGTEEAQPIHSKQARRNAWKAHRREAGRFRQVSRGPRQLPPHLKGCLKEKGLDSFPWSQTTPDLPPSLCTVSAPSQGTARPSPRVRPKS